MQMKQEIRFLLYQLGIRLIDTLAYVDNILSNPLT